MNSYDLLMDVLAAFVGLYLFIEAANITAKLNQWSAALYVRFPKLKSLLGGRNAGSELNTTITRTFLRVCGAFISIVSLISLTHTLLVRH